MFQSGIAGAHTSRADGLNVSYGHCDVSDAAIPPLSYAVVRFLTDRQRRGTGRMGGDRGSSFASSRMRPVKTANLFQASASSTPSRNGPSATAAYDRSSASYHKAMIRHYVHTFWSSPTSVAGAPMPFDRDLPRCPPLTVERRSGMPPTRRADAVANSEHPHDVSSETPDSAPCDMLEAATVCFPCEPEAPEIRGAGESAGVGRKHLPTPSEGESGSHLLPQNLRKDPEKRAKVKTEMCRFYTEGGAKSCPWGSKCECCESGWR